MNRIHEPKRTTAETRRLKRLLAENASFASLVFDLREVMDTHCASPNWMRAALRLVLHDSDWRVYRRLLNGLPPHEEQEEKEEEDVEEDGCDPLEF